MSGPYYNGAQPPSVEGWLDGQYEYMAPDKDFEESKGNPSYIPRDAYRDHTPEHSDVTSSSARGHRLPRDRYHSTAKERYTPASPPPEEDLERERDQHRHGSGQTHRRDRDYDVDREDHRPRHDRDTKYPPKADHGRPHRPPLNTATTSPHLTAGRPTADEDDARPRHRRYSQSSSPPLHQGDKSSRHHHHSRRHEDRSPSPPPRSSKKKDDRGRDRDSRTHHSGSGSSRGTSSSNTKPHRPALARSQTAPHGKDLKNGSSSRSFSFLNDPRFMTAAEAALQAGATAALASGGGKWGKDKGAKVIGAGLSAAALSALKGPAPAAAAAEPAPQPAPAPVPGAGAKAGDKAGRYVAGHVGRKESTRRRHH
ncbi:hypothetical protein VM1G_08307 [Cytospora mali]|uniref:Uncharacterized protein n=1 Tax=Cytospora mali TaxID=578113 RepID=A0A194W9J4_CYTMA|nr:hypothetical protein VM1G_08307 [Valsa mali]